MAEQEQNLQQQPEQPDIKMLEHLIFGTPLPNTPETPTDPAQPNLQEPNQPSAPTIQSEEEEIVDPNAYMQQRFGMEESALEKLVQEYNEIKSKPQTKTELEFANEQSKKIYQNLKEGKTKEVKSFLEAQDMLNGYDTMQPEQQLKLFLKLQNPRFDSELIQDEYDSLYKLNEDAFKDEDGNVDTIKMRKERLRIEQRIDNDLEKAKEHFSQYLQKVELPDILPTGNAVDDSFQAYQASSARAQEEYNNVIVPMINSLKEADVQMNFKVDDADNQMQFETSIIPNKEDFEEAKKAALNFESYINQSYYDENGKFLPNKIARAILLEKNFDKYVQSAMRQAVNAERKRVIGKEAGNGGGGGRDFDVHQQNELKELEKMIFRN